MITMSQLNRIAGYVQAGEGDTVSFAQDDATNWWTVMVGGHVFRSENLGDAFEMALAEANKYHAENYDMVPI